MKIQNLGNKQYIGDGVYVDFDSWQLVITTEDGIQCTNRIYIEPKVFKSLMEYIEKLNTPETRFP